MDSDVMPVGHLTQDQVQTVMRACAAAPFVRNERPWRLACTPTALELRAELPIATTSTSNSANSSARASARTSADGAAELDRRELLLSCGAALLNVRATIKVLGAHPAVRLLPDENQPDLLAVVRPQAGFPAAAADVALAEAIVRRRQSHPLTGGIPGPMINRLRQAARVEQTWLAFLPPDQLADLQLHLDGDVDGRDMDGRDMDGRDGTAVDNGTANGRPSAPRPNVMVAVVGTIHDSPLAWLQSGQGMQRVLLTAGAAGLTTSVLSQAVRATRTRAQLRELIGGAIWPQTVVRLESPTQSSATRSVPAAVPHEAVHRWVTH